MGILGRFFKKSKPAPVPVRPDASQAKQIISSVDYSPGKNICDQAQNSVEKLRCALQELKTVKLDDTMDARLLSAARESRDQLVLKIASNLDTILFPANYNYETLETTYNHLAQALNQIAATSLKHRYYSAVVFKDAFTKTTKEINKLSSLAKSLEEFLKQKKLEIAPYDEVVRREERRKNLLLAVDATRQTRTGLENRKRELEARVEALASEALGLQHDPSMQRIEELEGLKAELENEVFQPLSVLSKAFKRYENIGGLSSADKIVVRGCIESPLQTFLVDSSAVARIAEDLGRLVKTGQLDLKDNQKALAAVERIRSGSLNVLLAKHKNAEEELGRVKKSSKDFSDKRTTLEKQLKEANQELASLISQAGLLDEKLAEETKELKSLAENG